MIIQAELKYKQTGCEADPCAVDKVIELPAQRFRQFSRALLSDYDFIAENKDVIQRDEDLCVGRIYTDAAADALQDAGGCVRRQRRHHTEHLCAEGLFADLQRPEPRSV